MTQTSINERSDSAIRIKRVAQQLFAERGIDGVTVREIAEASGQKNHAAVTYYFGSKEALVRELIIDGAARSDQMRTQMLDELEQSKAPIKLRDVAEILVHSMVNFGPPEDVRSFHRFIFVLDMTERELLVDTLRGRWNSGYMRCFEHFSELMPEMCELRRQQKLVFVSRYVITVIAAREMKLEDTSSPHPIWADEGLLPHFIDTIVAILKAETSN